MRLIRSKIDKAATEAIAMEDILHYKVKELRVHHLEKEPTRPKKRRKVLGGDLLIMGEATVKMQVLELEGNVSENCWK